MAVCLDYQSVEYQRRGVLQSWSCALAACLLLFLALALKVAMKVQTTEVGYLLAQEQELAVVLDMERRDLELQRSVLLRPDRLEKAAYERLKLMPLDPSRARKIVVNPGEK